MGLLKLCGTSLSPNVTRVALILVEKEVPFELVDVEWGKMKSPEYLKFHPFAQMPFIVCETHVYCCFMDITTQCTLIFFRMMMGLFSTKAKRFAIISLPSIRTKEPHYFQLNLKPTPSSSKLYQYSTATSARMLRKPFLSCTTNRKYFLMV